MKTIGIATWLALLIGGGVSHGQDGKCGAAEIVCPRKGKCKGTCRKICANVASALKAIQKKTAKTMVWMNQATQT